MTAATDRHSRSNGQGQGRRWIRDEKRLAIMLRDGMCCSYCGVGVENEVVMTLDHLTPHSQGGTNDATNLTMACRRCNSARGNRGWREFAHAVADYINHGVTAAQIIAHIETSVQRPLDLSAAKELISRRGTFTAALRDNMG